MRNEKSAVGGDRQWWQRILGSGGVAHRFPEALTFLLRGIHIQGK